MRPLAGAQAVVARPGAGFAVPAQSRPDSSAQQLQRPGIPWPHVRPGNSTGMLVSVGWHAGLI